MTLISKFIRSWLKVYDHSTESKRSLDFETIRSFCWKRDRILYTLIIVQFHCLKFQFLRIIYFQEMIAYFSPMIAIMIVYFTTSHLWGASRLFSMDLGLLEIMTRCRAMVLLGLWLNRGIYISFKWTYFITVLSHTLRLKRKKTKSSSILNQWSAID